MGQSGVALELKAELYLSRSEMEISSRREN